MGGAELPAKRRFWKLQPVEETVMGQVTVNRAFPGSQDEPEE
jgi:hypothetical protein